MESAQRTRVKIFTTGGSLDKGYSTKESAFVVGKPRIDALLREANVAFEFEVESLLQKDSLELTDQDRELIRRKVEGDPARYILITHGTDTMALTGRHLKGIQGKTVVLTGAMQPAAFKVTDAHFNIGFALAALQLLPPGIYLAMNGAVFDPETARKNPRLDRFEGPHF